jgi:SAM-dependent methyltransferase
VGTFGTSYYAIPTLGLQGTLLLTAGLICLGALVASGIGSQHKVAGLMLVALVSYSADTGAPSPDVLAVGESPYQQVRVTQLDDGLRALEVNEQRGSFQSVWSSTPGLLGTGFYYDYFSLPASWSGATGNWEALVLGLGAGTAWRVLEGALPEGVELDATGVELDPLVIELAREHMGLSPSKAGRRIISGWDARVALGPLFREGGRWDQVIVDVYANQVEIPPHMATVEFFSEARRVLKPGGWLQVNVGGGGCDDPVVLATGASLAQAFGSPTLALEVPLSRNVVLIQRHQAPVLAPLDPDFLDVGAELEDLVKRVQISGTWAFIDVGDGLLLMDQRAPMESLQRESFSHFGGEG